MQVGVVGLGAMGRNIALKLLDAGHEVTVWNRNPTAVDELVASGAIRAPLVGDALQGDIVLSVLFDDDAIRATLLGEDALAIANKDGIHVCLSTVTVAFGGELKTFHADRGLEYVGAPMLGRPDVIERAALNILCAGRSELLDRIEAPLTCLGKVWRLGSDPVHAQVAKLAANFMISAALESMAEAVALLRSQGADADHFLSVMSETLFAAFVYKSYGPMVAGRVPDMPSGLSLPLKDNLSFLKAADGTGIHVPLAETVRSNLTRASEMGLGEDDWSTALAAVARGEMR